MKDSVTVSVWKLWIPAYMNIFRRFKCCCSPFPGEVEGALGQASENLVAHPTWLPTCLGDLKLVASFSLSLSCLISKMEVVPAVHSS